MRLLRWLLPTCLVLSLSGCADEEQDAPGSGGSSAGGAGGGGSTGGGSAGRSGASGGDSGGSAGATGGNGGTTGGTGDGSGGGSAGSTNAGGRAGSGTAGASGAMAGSAAGGAPAGGSASSGDGGEEPRGGAGGTGGGTPDICTFEVAGTPSEDMPTVGVITWSTDLAGLTAARVEFSLDDPGEGELNVGSGGPISVSAPRALLLGLKQNRSYTYRVVASAGATTCVSADQKLVTGALARDPGVTRVLVEPAAPRANGFIVACIYDGTRAMILDTDGDVVWLTEAPPQCSRAHMDWDGEFVWMMRANPTYDSAGDVRRVRMDGSGAEAVAGLELTHHDFAVLPQGTLAFLAWADEADLSSDLVERSADGTLRTLARLDGDTYRAPSRRQFHANALRYSASDDGYTVSDLELPGLTKFDRQGQPEWQLRSGCSGAPAAECASESVNGMHGHQLLENGNVLYFEAINGSVNPGGGPSPVYEYSLREEAGELTATLVWSHVDEARSWILGDVQRLANGNTLVTYSTDGSTGVIHEVTPEGGVVQTFGDAGEFGYTTFRETLYGPPR